MPNFLSGTWAVAVVATLLFVVGVAVGCGGGEEATITSVEGTTTGTAAPLKTSLNGAGATFPQPLYLEWMGEFCHVEPDVKMNYQGIGSGGGIQQFIQQTVDFGASDVPMKDEEILEAERASGGRVLHIPTVFGAVVVAYNLPGLGELKLDQETLAGLFLGEIKSWNDPRLSALNPGLNLPNRPVQIVRRSDSSGTTSIFTGYLSQISSTWKDRVGQGKEVQWPVGIGGKGNDGVSAIIKQQQGSLGYVELSYALESNLPVATLKNQAGNFVKPTLESTSAAGEKVSFPDDLRFSLTNAPGPKAYPIVGATWILAYDKMKDPLKARALKEFLSWALKEGDQIAQDLNYAPLPPELEAMALAKVEEIG